MTQSRRERQRLYRQNVRTARLWWPELDKVLTGGLRDLTLNYGLRLDRGDLQLLDGRWYVTHSGLLSLAARRGCAGIEVSPLLEFSAPSQNRWALKATVYRSKMCRGFDGFGDAEPSNVTPIVRGSELRIAETRAVNRALRKAYGIGLCSMEEIGASSGPLEPAAQARKQPRQMIVSANGSGHHLRDRLLVLIRQQKLDGALVKAYAADFCGVKELREASREQVQEFINHLSEYSASDREGLLCQLNSYSPKQESAA